jgi:predicted DNA-binding transcriptional regulator AlpA
MVQYSSRQAAQKLGLPVSTLATYMSAGKIPVPKSVTTGGITVYLWTDEDIDHVRQLLPKIANGRKTRYKKKPSAVSTQQSGKKQSAIGTQQSAKAKAKAKSKTKKRSKP